ncbi:MAG: STAS domain-containing protein [Thermodesulfovibrionales bacterium]
MTVSVKEKEGVATLCLEEDMTIFTAAALKKALLESLESLPELVLDLSGVAEMDTAGFQLLVLARREAAAAGKGFRVAAGSPAVEAVFEVYAMKDLVGR